MQYHKNDDMIRFYPVIQQSSIWISYSNKAPLSVCPISVFEKSQTECECKRVTLNESQNACS